MEYREEGEEEQNLVFHYDRKKRLEHAPQMVQDYYSGAYKMPPKGLFKMLVWTRSSRIMLLVLVACLVITLFVGLLGKSADEGQYADIPMKLTAFSFQDTVYAQVMLKEPKKSKETFDGSSIPVYFEFRFIDADGALLDTVTCETFYEGKELPVGTTSGDYDILTVEADITINGETTSLKGKVSRN